MLVVEKSREISGPAIRHKELNTTGVIEAIDGDEADVVLHTGLNQGSPMRVRLSEIELIAQKWPW